MAYNPYQNKPYNECTTLERRKFLWQVIKDMSNKDPCAICVYGNHYTRHPNKLCTNYVSLYMLTPISVYELEPQINVYNVLMPLNSSDNVYEGTMTTSIFVYSVKPPHEIRANIDLVLSSSQ